MKKYSFATTGLWALLAAGLPAQVPLNPNPSRVIGHPNLTVNTAAPNFVEGRELDNPNMVAVDTSANPPALYVSDSNNNRVLAWKDAAHFANGALADLVIGQRDFFSTGPQGPGRQFSTLPSSGLTGPSGLVTDSSGNLYVVDSGNDRILRFNKPFSQSGQILPDMVIGQPNFTSRFANTGGLSEKTIATNSDANRSDCSNNCFDARLAFDSSGNLWFTDTLNNRVLRYRAADLCAGCGNGPGADLVLGQSDFVTNSYNNPTNDVKNANVLRTPAGIAFDSGGHLFVSDSLNRVLVYTPPFTNGKPAARFLGIFMPQQQGQNPTPDSIFNNPEGVIALGDRIGVNDLGNNRIMIFRPFDQWSSDMLSQQAQFVIGQADFTTRLANRGQPESGANTLQAPFGATLSNGELYVADTGNHRVLVFPQLPTGNFADATRVLGQVAMNYHAPDLVEARGLNLVAGGSADSGIAIDVKTDPPHLYVADTYNNRVLGYRDLRKIKTGDPADLVIGQTDMFHSLANAPGNKVDIPTDQGLRAPTGLALDSDGNLYVADTGNGRVMRFPKPFDVQQNFPRGDLVLGQRNFTSKIADPTSATMANPYGLAFSFNGSLFVSDAALNRVLMFPGPPANFSNGMPATRVFGQPGFISINPGAEDNRFNSPHHIAIDGDDRLYVVDSGNNRIQIFTRAPLAGADPRPVLSLSNLNGPRGIYITPLSNDIWVADTNNTRVLRYPKFDNLIVNSTPTVFATNQNNLGPPMAVAQDAFGDLYVADIFNRIGIFYPGLAAANAANFFPATSGPRRPLAPGVIATLFPPAGGSLFGNDTKSYTDLPNPTPLPTVLADIQVLVNGTPAPLFYVSPGQINFRVPTNAPTSGTAEFQVIRASTSQILGSFPVQMDVAAPGIFNIGGTQAAVINQDGTINGQRNPAPIGSIISIYATGPGVIPGEPPDGAPASGAISTDVKPDILIGDVQFVPPENVTYSGLAPGFVGVWQINVKIPGFVPPTATTNNVTRLVVRYKDITSNLPGSINASIWVKPAS